MRQGQTTTEKLPQYIAYQRSRQLPIRQLSAKLSTSLYCISWWQFCENSEYPSGENHRFSSNETDKILPQQETNFLVMGAALRKTELFSKKYPYLIICLSDDKLTFFFYIVIMMPSYFLTLPPRWKVVFLTFISPWQVTF